jgi:hypothetical protein
MTSQAERVLLWGFLKAKLDGLTRDELQKFGEEEKPIFIVQPNPPDNGFYCVIRRLRSLPHGLLR